MDDLSNKEIMDKIQEIALWISTQDNELLKPHFLPFMDKSLKTENKAIIKSINELKQRLDINDNSLETFMNQLLPIIGDWKINPDFETDLQAIAPSILEAIIEIGKGGKTSKTITFQYFKKLRDIERLTIRSPYSGEIIEVIANCSTVGLDDTDLIVEKISKDDFENGIDNWIEMCNLTIKGGDYTDNKMVVLIEKNVEIGDIFRVKVVNNGGLEDLNVQIVYEID